MLRSCRLIVYVLSISLLGYSQESQIPPKKVLSSTSRISLNIPMFGSVGKTICDSSGNLFFNIGKQVPEAGPFLKIARDGENHWIYSLPQSVQSWGSPLGAVTPDGHFYTYIGNGLSFKLISYKPDGSILNIVDLPLQQHSAVNQIAVADSGVMGLSGTIASEDPKANFKTFTYLFNSDGRLLRDLSQFKEEVTHEAEESRPPSGDLVAGDDGRFYIVRAKDISVLNQSGEEEHDFPLPTPDTGSYPSDTWVSGGAISVSFESLHPIPDRATEIETRTIVLDTQSGGILGNYTFDPNLTGSVLCFTRSEGYKMMAVQHRFAATDILPLR